ncbi:MAG: RidA family protein [Gammaproteobacteria bacterium]|nr:RidA family protein [Gammaproteobacteria bacterium]
MAVRKAIHTDDAPGAIGTYSQAVRVGDAVYLSGQIPLDPVTMEMVPGGFEAQAIQAFENLQAVARAAGGGFADVVKLNVYLADLADFPQVNAVMGRYFTPPYPARAAVQVAALPRGAAIEIDAVMHL